MNTRIIIDGRSYDLDELAQALRVMLPDKYPELWWDVYYKAWSVLDQREVSRK